MKKVIQITKISVLFFFIILIASCSSSDSNNTTGGGNISSQTVVQIAQGRPELSRFVEAVNKTGIGVLLSLPTATQTVFAPTNAAFDAKGISSAVISGYSTTQVAILKEILLNHVFNTTKNASQLATGYYKTSGVGTSSTVNTLSMYINNSSGVVINGGINNSGASVTTADIAALNGVVHIVDGVILPPTLLGHAKANPLFTKLVTAVTSTPADPFGDQSSILNGLTNATSSTLFAPTNDAFTAANANSGGFLVGLTGVQKTRVLQYHLVNGNVISTSLNNNQIVETTANQLNTTVKQTIKVLLTGAAGPRIEDKSSFGLNYGKLLSPSIDIQCANGVIHMVDKVLQPNL